MPQWLVKKGGFRYSTKVASSIQVTYRSGYNSVTDIIYLPHKEEGKRKGYLTCFIKRAFFEVGSMDVENKSLFDQFDTEWLPFFRRGCWLSGAPIEVSAHEKAEWMQGFTHDEVKT